MLAAGSSIIKRQVRTYSSETYNILSNKFRVDVSRSVLRKLAH